MADIAFELTPRPPFRLDLTAWVLRRRRHNLIDYWDGRTYRRVLVVQGQPVRVTVRQTGPVDSPKLQVNASGENLDEATAVPVLTALLTRMLSLNSDLEGFYRLAANYPSLQELVAPWRGFKPPRFPSIFEALVNAVACQQLSLTVGIHLLNRLAAAYGPGFREAEEVVPAFPRPIDLAEAKPEDLRRLGFSRGKGRTLTDLAQNVVHGRLDLESLDSLDDAEVVQQLQGLRGIGRWSAEYVLLRGLGRRRIFPGDDVGARRRLQTWLALPEPLTYRQVGSLLADWQPFGGLVYFHLLLSHLAEEGNLTA